MAAHLVDTSDDESLLLVANHISQLLDNGQARSELVDTEGSAFYKECLEALEDSEYAAILKKFIGQVDLLFERAKPGDLQTSLCVTVHLLRALNSSQHAEFAQQLAEKVSSNLSREDEHADQRLAVLTDIFNSTTDPPVQYNVLLKAVRVAKSANRATSLASGLRSNLDAWIKAWDLPKAQERELLFAVAELFRTNVKRKVLLREAYKLSVRALSTLEDGDTQEIAQLKSIALHTVADFLNSPEVFQFDLLSAPSITQLERDPDGKPLFDILNNVVSGNVEGVRSTADSGSSLLSAHNLVKADLVAKTQLMGIMELAAQSNELSYQTLRDRLLLEDDDAVEDWLVRAIGKRLIQGQMDQERRSITISKAANRTFGTQDWRILQKQLSAWKLNVGNAWDLIASGDKYGVNGSVSGQSWRQSQTSNSQFRPPVRA